MREQPSSDTDTLCDTCPSLPVSQYSCDKTRVERLSLRIQRPSMVESKQAHLLRESGEKRGSVSRICQASHLGRWRKLQAVGTWGSRKMKETARGLG